MNDRFHIHLAHDLARDLVESTTLPRLDARTRDALNRLHDERAAPLSFAWRGQTCHVQWAFETAASMPPLDAYRFKLGARTGLLGLDRPAQIALFGEPRLEPLPRDLRAILLADATHEIVEALMRATRGVFEWLPVDEAADWHADEQAACFRITTASEPGAGWRGFVRFDDAAALAELVPPLAAHPAVPAGSASGDRLARLRFPLRWQIGATPIRLREVRSIRPGDLVGVEEWQSAGAAIVASAEVGGRRLLALAEGSRITIQQSRDNSTMNRNPDTAPPTTAPQDAASPPLDHLDALEVTLRFEVGDLAVSLGELRNLRAGHVFELGQPLNRSEVRIVAHGNLLGKGYLVAVGERLGVRVSEFAPSEI